MEITEATCKVCGLPVVYEIIERPWNGQVEIRVEPCQACLDAEYVMGADNAKGE